MFSCPVGGRESSHPLGAITVHAQKKPVLRTAIPKEIPRENRIRGSAVSHCKVPFPINPWCEISAGDNSGTGFPCSAFAGGSWVGDRTHPFGTKMLLQAVLPRHGCPGTAFHGVGNNLQDLPTLSHHHPHAQHPKFLWCLSQNQKQVDFPGPSAPLHEPGVRNSSGVSLPSEMTHIFPKVGDFTSPRAGTGDLCPALVVC